MPPRALVEALQQLVEASGLQVLPGDAMSIRVESVRDGVLSVSVSVMDAELDRTFARRWPEVPIGLLGDAS